MLKESFHGFQDEEGSPSLNVVTIGGPYSSFPTLCRAKLYYEIVSVLARFEGKSQLR